MWTRTYIHFANGGEHWFVFLKPDVPGNWLLSSESTKGKSRAVENVSFCASKKKKKNRLSFSRPAFSQSLLGEKLLIKTEKVNYSLQ